MQNWTEWIFGISTAGITYFLYDLHAAFKEHMRDSAERGERLVKVETIIELNGKHIRENLDSIGEDLRTLNSKIDQLMSRK